MEKEPQFKITSNSSDQPDSLEDQFEGDSRGYKEKYSQQEDDGNEEDNDDDDDDDDDEDLSLQREEKEEVKLMLKQKERELDRAHHTKNQSV